MNEKLFEKLKTKVSPLGFNEEELKAVAEALSKSIDSAEGEPTDDKIEGLISLAMPALEASQKVANRVVSKKQKEFAGKQKEFEDKIKALTNTPTPEPEPKPTGSESDKGIETLTKMFKEYMDKTEQRFATLDAQNVSKTRKQQLEELLKDSGSFGARAMKEFERMSFKDDEDFTAYLADTKSDLEAYNKERAEAGLPNVPIGGSVNRVNKPNEVITDAQVEAIAKQF